MRVVLLTDSYLPNKTSVARMIDELALELVNIGHSVTIVTSTRELSAPFQVEQHAGLRICRVRAGKGDHIGRVSRAIAELTLPFLVWHHAKAELENAPPEIVVSYSPTIFWGYVVGRIKRKHRSRAYLILRDIFPQWAVDIGLLSRNNPAYWLFRAVEKLQYRVADRIGVQSPSNTAYFKGSPELEEKIEILWNWASAEAPAPVNPSFRERLGLLGKTVFFYGGNMGVAQQMDRLVRLAVALRANPNVHFVLVGEGSERERINREAQQRGLTNMHVLPPVSQNEFLVMLHEFDVGVVLLDPQLTTHNIPGKLISYATAGKPILAEVNAGNDVIALLHDHRAGLASANDESALLLNSNLLADSVELRTELGGNAKRLAEKLFSVKSAALQISLCRPT